MGPTAVQAEPFNLIRTEMVQVRPYLVRCRVMEQDFKRFCRARGHADVDDVALVAVASHRQLDQRLIQQGAWDVGAGDRVPSRRRRTKARCRLPS